MSGHWIQILILAGIALFLILRLRAVLGTREGFEKPSMRVRSLAKEPPELEVIDGGREDLVSTYFEEDSSDAAAVRRMMDADPDFSIDDFIQGARKAYETILMAYERGEIDVEIEALLEEDVFEAFMDALTERDLMGLTVEAEFIGVREARVVGAEYDEDANIGRIQIMFVSELTSVVRDVDKNIVEGDPKEVKRQKDFWVFQRCMSERNPNWTLAATDA